MFIDRYPQCRYAMFQANSVRLALEKLTLESTASILLPPHIAQPLVLSGQLEEVSCLEDISISLLVSSLKSSKVNSLTEFLDFYAAPSTYGTFLS